MTCGCFDLGSCACLSDRDLDFPSFQRSSQIPLTLNIQIHFRSEIRRWRETYTSGGLFYCSSWCDWYSTSLELVFENFPSQPDLPPTIAPSVALIVPGYCQPLLPLSAKVRCVPLSMCLDGFVRESIAPCYHPPRVGFVGRPPSVTHDIRMESQISGPIPLSLT